MHRAFKILLQAFILAATVFIAHSLPVNDKLEQNVVEQRPYAWALLYVYYMLAFAIVIAMYKYGKKL